MLMTFLRLSIDNFSVKQILHFYQINQSKKFQMYDYGLKNERIYGSTDPPSYNLSAIDTPIYIIYGTHDGTTAKKVCNLFIVIFQLKK